MPVALLAGLFGLLIGSFLNVCIYRLPRDLSVVRPRSHCPECGRMIAWYDNIPVLSYFVLRRRCRGCGVAIPATYPLVEALTGTLFAVAVLLAGPGWAALKLCVFSAILIDLFFTDWETRILPDEFTLGGTALGLLLAFVVPMPAFLFTLLLPDGASAWMRSLAESVGAAVFASGLLWLSGAAFRWLRHKEGVGFGDVKMLALLGAFLGLQGVVASMLFGSVLGLLAGLAFWLRYRNEQDVFAHLFPFGSYLAVAAAGYGFWSAWVGTGSAAS